MQQGGRRCRCGANACSGSSVAAATDSKAAERQSALSLVPDAFVPRGGAVSASHVAALWLHARIGCAMTNAAGWCEPRALSVPAERHGLTAWYERGCGLPNGRVGQHSPGQPVAAWSSSGARRTQQAHRGADRRALWARPGDGHCLRGSSKPRAQPVDQSQDQPRVPSGSAGEVPWVCVRGWTYQP